MNLCNFKEIVEVSIKKLNRLMEIYISKTFLKLNNFKINSLKGDQRLKE